MLLFGRVEAPQLVACRKQFDAITRARRTEARTQYSILNISLFAATEIIVWARHAKHSSVQNKVGAIRTARRIK